MGDIVCVETALFVVVIVLIVWFVSGSLMWTIGAGVVAWWAAASDMFDESNLRACDMLEKRRGSQGEFSPATAIGNVSAAVTQTVDEITGPGAAAAATSSPFVPDGPPPPPSQPQ